MSTSDRDAPAPGETPGRRGGAVPGSYAPENRAEALHLALQALRDRVEPDRVLACELAWEVHAHGYWSQIRRPMGPLRHRGGLLPGRPWAGLVADGLQASGRRPDAHELRGAGAPLRARSPGWASPRRRWWPRPSSASANGRHGLAWLGSSRVALQARVSDALEALPRGPRAESAGGALPPHGARRDARHRGDGAGRAILHLGGGSSARPNPIAIFLAGCRECLPEWELQAARTFPSVDIERRSGFCPRGQNPEGDAQ